MANKYEIEQSLRHLKNAIRDGNNEAALAMVKEIPAEKLFTPTPDEEGKTCLHNAIGYGRDEIAIAIINKKNVTAEQLLLRDNNGRSALQDAIEKNRENVIWAFIENKHIRTLSGQKGHEDVAAAINKIVNDSGNKQLEEWMERSGKLLKKQLDALDTWEKRELLKKADNTERSL